MTEMFNGEKRVIFPKNKQSQFLLKVKNQLELSWPNFAQKINVHKRTLSDWKRERYSIPLCVLKKICNIANLKMPLDIEIKDRFWYVEKAGKIAGKLTYKRYGAIGGNPEIRQRKWRSWWLRIGKFKLPPSFISKEIKKPNKKSIELAEFAGIMMGDGGITKRQITISLNYKADKEYIIFVKNLIVALFNIEPALYKREEESIINIVVSRTKLVLFCKLIGLMVGNKIAQNLDIPLWIQRNKKYSVACIRGLMDTDGCIYEECHTINNRRYCYPRLSFVSASNQLRLSVLKILKQLAFTPVMRNNRSVQLEKRDEIIRYFEIIDTNNYKHKKRYQQMMFGGVG
ncbi:hypothetical protein KKH13_03130 [Patescibacteria group bacterium]|nr:hypothetical protein [Patescibacteria group bacterium]